MTIEAALSNTNRQKQLDLFSERAARDTPARRTIQGRVRFFPRRTNAIEAANDARPFDDPLSDLFVSEWRA